MIVQYGIWCFDGRPVEVHNFWQASQILGKYGPDGLSTSFEASLGLMCGAFHTVPESPRATQPYVLPTGTIVVWDGRLDNRNELIPDLDGRLDRDSADVELVAAWFQQWGPARLGSLIGDWALTVWDPNHRSLLLAKDFLGTRHLYYRFGKGRITWSTVLDPLVRSSESSLTLCEEYLAGCLAGLPAPHLTPYNEVREVAPSSYLLVKDGRTIERKYWDFNPSKLVCYRTDCEYQAHFFDLLRQSIRRRLRSEGTVLAELSGGMDSSSIVCVADELIAAGDADCRDLETISYFSASEPDWDEAPYFGRVEKRRGRTGFHIDVGSCGFFRFAYGPGSSSLSPSVMPKTPPDEQIDQVFQKSGHRVLLSGIGGDEFLGGVPTAVPELADLLVGCELFRLAHQLKKWALAQRKPWLHLLAAAAQDFLPFRLRAGDAVSKPAPWIRPSFAERDRYALAGYPERIRFSGARPSFQHAVGTVDVLRRSVAWFSLSPSRLCERRYPYLDRCLLEFLFSIPREQLLQPGHRRSLMRRSVRGVVPDEIITRKRKAFVSRAPLVALRQEWESLVRPKQFLTASLGIVDQALLLRTMRDARDGRETPLLPLVRTVALECWLRHLATERIPIDPEFAELHAVEIPVLPSPQQKGGERDEIREAGSRRAR